MNRYNFTAAADISLPYPEAASIEAPTLDDAILRAFGDGAAAGADRTVIADGEIVAYYSVDMNN